MRILPAILPEDTIIYKGVSWEPSSQGILQETCFLQIFVSNPQEIGKFLVVCYLILIIYCLLDIL
jgi:hypothetical protein